MLLRMMVLALALLSQSVYAQSRFGLGVVTGSYSVDDPKGSTDSANETSLFGVMTIPVNRNFPDWRYWFGLNYNAFELEPSTQDVGQEVTSVSIETILQKGFNVSSEIKPYAGLGVGVGANDFTKRHTIDSDGYLAERYEDRSETSFYLIANLGVATRKLDSGFFIGTSLSYKTPLEDGIEATELNLFFLY